jgi:hypothetical protein
MAPAFSKPTCYHQLCGKIQQRCNQTQMYTDRGLVVVITNGTTTKVLYVGFGSTDCILEIVCNLLSISEEVFFEIFEDIIFETQIGFTVVGNKRVVYLVGELQSHHHISTNEMTGVEDNLSDEEETALRCAQKKFPYIFGISVPTCPSFYKIHQTCGDNVPKVGSQKFYVVVDREPKETLVFRSTLTPSSCLFVEVGNLTGLNAGKNGPIDVTFKSHGVFQLLSSTIDGNPIVILYGRIKTEDDETTIRHHEQCSLEDCDEKRLVMGLCQSRY